MSREYLTMVFLLSMISCGMCQGLVNFANTPKTLISVQNLGEQSIMNGQPGAYYFGLLTNGTASGSYTFTGVYATNLAAPGMLSGGTGVPVPGLTPGQTFYYEIAGWSANLGHDFNPRWLTGNAFQPSYLNPLFGVSNPGFGLAGGRTGSTTLPAFELFGGTNGLSGFYLFNAGTLVPAPGLAIARQADKVIVTWSPGPAVGLSLQSTTNLALPMAWTAISPAPVVTSATGAITNQLTKTQEFFRFSQ